MSRRVAVVARTSRRAVAAREESSSPREETFAAAIATPLDAGTSNGEILLNARDSSSEGVDFDERERGDDRHRARDDSAVDDVRALPDWWKKVDRAPICVQGVDALIPTGPYQSGKDATAALKRLAEGRSVKLCTTRHGGSKSFLMCKGVVDAFKKTGRRELLPGYDCAYTALAFIEQYLVNSAELVAELKTTVDVLQTRLDRGESPFTPCVQKSIDKVRLDAAHNVQRVIATPNNYDFYQVVKDARVSTPGLRTNHVNALERTCTCRGRAINGYACMHEYAVYLHARDNDNLRHLGMTDFPAWAAQPSMHAETFIEAVNNAFVYLPPATEVTLDETRRPPGHLQSATQRARARPRRRNSSLGRGARTINTRSQRH